VRGARLHVGRGLGRAGGAGAVLWVVGFLLPMPVSPGNVREMTDEYNNSLLRNLGLSGAREQRGGSLRLSLAPTGLSLSGTF